VAILATISVLALRKSLISNPFRGDVRHPAGLIDCQEQYDLVTADHNPNVMIQRMINSN
jgi:hypothetical protein